MYVLKYYFLNCPDKHLPYPSATPFPTLSSYLYCVATPLHTAGIMEKTELLALARAYATTEDLFDLLGIDALDAEDEAQVRRAWRKASLKYHPDKVGGPTGAGFDDKMKAKWELLERAREILSDPKAREVYVSARGAAKLQEEKKAAMNAKQREMLERLETAEKAGREAKNPPVPKAKSDAEILAEKQATERGRQILEKRKQLMREALEREQRAKEEEDRRLAEKEAELEQRLEESRQRKEAKRARRAAKEAHRARNGTSTTSSADGQANAAPPEDSSAAKTPLPPTRAQQGPSPHPKMDALLARLRREKAERDAQAEREKQENGQQEDK